MNMKHIVRNHSTLGGLWDFKFLNQTSMPEVDLKALEFDDRIMVPAAFDAITRYQRKRGTGCYRTSIDVPVGYRGCLLFEAVSMGAQVFIDGELVGSSVCGYAPFIVEVPEAVKTTRELIVLAENRFDFEARPMHEEYFDFYQYGGIIRNIRMNLLPVGQPTVKSIQVTPTDAYQVGAVTVAIQLDGTNFDTTTLTFSIDGEVVDLAEALDASGRVEFEATVSHPSLWSPESPNLHRAQLLLSDVDGLAYDDAQVVFGLRKLEARGPKLFLNDAPLELRGYNRHEFHPNYGPSTPELQMFADIRVMKDMGCNFVRGSHYPQDQRFLDLCDEMGILVWEENLGWQQQQRAFDHKDYAAHHLVALKAMVNMSYNHPCVVMWGFLNEAYSDEACARPVFEESARTLRAMDPSRLITFGSIQNLRDKVLDLFDIISLNIYPGWYGAVDIEDPITLIRPKIEELADGIDAMGFADKPLMISEIGAEALYGWHDAHEDFFTEEFQARYLVEASQCVLEHPRYSGICLWHFSDARTYGGGLAIGRPRTYNNKGTFDEYRRPKMAYDAVKTVFMSR
jgi:beta-glucuronidase